jgi:glycosyltransferase involved in cell wall biosynthesis
MNQPSMPPFVLVAADFIKTGGMDRANYALAEYLASQGRAVTLVAYRVAPELLAHENVKFVQVPKLLNSYALSEPLIRAVGRQQAKRSAQQAARVLVNGGNCFWNDINWVHYVHAAYQPASYTGWLRSLKQRYAYQTSCQDERASLQAAKVIIANSKQTRQDLIEKLNIPQDRIQVIYLGIDPALFYPPTNAEKLALREKLGWSQERKKAIFVGGLGDRRKGFDTLFEAWVQLAQDPGWDADLAVIGRGAELPQWQKRAQEIGLQDRVEFLGFRSDVSELLRAADCLVAPTRYEPYGLGVHEALCCGLPAIVSAQAGIAERYPTDLQDLLLSDPNDVPQLVSLLQRWRHQPTYYQSQTHRLSTSLRLYTWESMAKEMLETVLKQKSP